MDVIIACLSDLNIYINFKIIELGHYSRCLDAFKN